MANSNDAEKTEISIVFNNIVFPVLKNLSIDEIKDIVEYVRIELLKNGFVVNAKEGNFIFVKPRKVDADIIVERMKQEKKILIKSYSEIGTLGICLRVTTGEKIYMEKFLEALLDIDK